MTSPSDTVRAALADDNERAWLFGRTPDLLAFGGSAVLAFVLVGVGYGLGLLDHDTPPWVWLLCVVGVDVAHVWSTIFRVYLDPAEVRRRAVLYLGAPIAVYLAGLLLFGMSPTIFWTVVAYTAVFHFVRQQVGWMRLYHRRDPSIAKPDRVLDTATLYLSMVYPLAAWHARLPRKFAWMIEGDFVRGLSPLVAKVLASIYACCLLVWFVRFGVVGRKSWGRLLLLTSTALTWYVGIVALNSDFTFTVLNVLVHGIPYFFLTFRYGTQRASEKTGGVLHSLARYGWPAFLALVVALAFVEETFWDRLVWHDHPHLFGTASTITNTALAFIVPLLATPQLTHYLLDGFIWRRDGNTV